MFDQGFLGALHKPGERSDHTRRREEHLKRLAEGVTRFPAGAKRFPPYRPSKSYQCKFGMPGDMGASAIFGYDDTNPEAEEAAYFEAIKEIVDG